MGRVLRYVGPGLLGLGIGVGATLAYRLWADIDRSLVSRPVPIHFGKLTKP